MRTRAKARIGIAGLGAVVLATAFAAPAFADYQPIPGDVVGIGGDTPQYDLQFLAGGDTHGDLGFNAAGAFNRLVTFNAVADGNGRQAYTNSVSTGVPSVALNPTDVLRAGTAPVQRTQSSGDALSAFVLDTANPPVINFIFSGSLPTPAQQSTAASNGWGFLHVVQISTDNIVIAAKSGTNAPAGLSAAELLKIYTGQWTTWGQVTGYTGSAPGDTIVPLLPPTSSTVYKTLIADLTAANGGSAPTIPTSIKTVEQNDPSVLTTADQIVPFSQARLNLYATNYFRDPSSKFPGGAAVPSGVVALTGTPPDSGTAENTLISHYVIFRNSDASSTTPFEPGGSRNWVQTLFSNPGGSAPLVDKTTGEALITASGATPAYNDLGNVHS